MNLRTIAVLTLAIATPLFAQTEESNSAPPRKLRVISEAQTANYLAKFDGVGTGTVSDSILYEANGNLGIGTTDPKVRLHVSAAAAGDMAIGIGPDPSGASGSALNVGYGGFTFGRAAGFFNVRPDASATGVNPSLRFLTGDIERMIVTNAGWVGIGTSAPAYRLHVLSADVAGTSIGVENTNSTSSGAYATLRTTSSLANTSYVAHGNRAGTLSRFGIPLEGWSEIVNFSGNGQIIGTNLDRPLVFGTNNVERMRIHGDGKVSIGGPNNGGKLNVVGGAGSNAIAFWAAQPSSLLANGVQNATGLSVSASHSIPGGSTNTGGVVGAQIDGWNYGPGVTTFATAATFHVGNVPGSTGTVTHAYGVQTAVMAAGGSVVNGYGLYIHDTEATNDYGVYQTGVNDSNYFAGNVVIGHLSNQSAQILTVNGNAQFWGTVTGTNIKAHYQDVAEWVPSTTDLAPGTVVILNRDRNNEVMASATAYDTSVAGVVSAQPGITLGVEGEGMETIATTGRVKVRVDARTNPVGVGDLLVTSDIPGTAMRSEPMDINGRKFHQPGTIIGKALEPLAGGIGEILVLLSMQ